MVKKIAHSPMEKWRSTWIWETVLQRLDLLTGHSDNVENAIFEQNENTGPSRFQKPIFLLIKTCEIINFRRICNMKEKLFIQ